MQASGRVGRVAEHDQVGVGRRLLWVEVERGERSTRSTGWPAARSAASGAAKDGWTQTARRGLSPRASSVNASAAPLVNRTWVGSRRCRAATAETAASGRG